LLIAAERGNAKAVMMLLDAGADITAVDNQQKGIMHYLPSSDDNKLIETVLKKGASFEQQDIFGKCPLHYAIELNNLDAVGLLLHHQFTLPQSSSFSPAASAATSLPVLTIPQIHQRDNEGREALHYVLLQRLQGPQAKTNELILSELIRQGAHVDAKDNKGNTPLHYAARNNPLTIPLLLQVKADPNCKDSKGNTPLHSAVLSSNLESINILVADGANINAADAKQKTPLHLAVENNDDKAVAVLIKLKANLECKDDSGNPPPGQPPPTPM
jgi:uncharacterized protein